MRAGGNDAGTPARSTGDSKPRRQTMTSQFSKLLPALGVALALSACASLGSSPPKADQVARIHPGLTQDEVGSLVGDPGSVIHNTFENAIIWVYPLSTDVNGSEFDVEFKDGVVTESFTLQHQSGS